MFVRHRTFSGRQNVVRDRTVQLIQELKYGPFARHYTRNKLLRHAFDTRHASQSFSIDCSVNEASHFLNFDNKLTFVMCSCNRTISTGLNGLYFCLDRVVAI